MPEGQDKERRVLRAVIDALNELDSESRARILRTSQTFFGLDMLQVSYPTGSATQTVTSRDPGAPAFSSKTELSPKEFLFQKQPHTDIERIACLAYYLTHYRAKPHFKTVDFSKLNTEAAQIKFSNAANAVINATHAGLLVQAGQGNKQLSARGELYVEALPDREAVKAIPSHLRKKGKRSASNRK